MKQEEDEWSQAGWCQWPLAICRVSTAPPLGRQSIHSSEIDFVFSESPLCCSVFVFKEFTATLNGWTVKDPNIVTLTHSRVGRFS